MIAQYPPMGWNSWDCYGAAVAEDTVRKNADYMAAHLKPFGWEYVVVDIQWYQPTAVNHEYESFADVVMDDFGRLLPAVNRFPSAADGAGFKPLADYVHSLGLKFGIHIMRGMPRMSAHRRLPIEGSGYFCHQAANPNSVCAWNPDMYGLRYDRPEKWCIHAGPGHWPDADMLPLGALRQCEDPSDWTRFTPAEQRTMMTLWCVMRSPLMIGGELTKNDDFTLSLLTNADLLAVERESWCAHPILTTEEESVWIAPRSRGDGCYVALFNLSDKTRRVSLPGGAAEFPWTSARELWTGAVRSARQDVQSRLPAHDASIWLLT